MGSKRYYSYDGKKAWTGVGKKVLVDDAWLDAVNAHFANNGYDDLLAVVGRILKDGGFSDISRAQAWVITQDVLNDGVPEILRDNDVDESIGKGHLMFDYAQKAAKVAVNTTVSAGNMAVSTASNVVGAAQTAIVGEEEPTEEEASEESPSEE